MPIISPWIFYLINVFDTLKQIGIIVVLVLGFVIVLSLCSLFCNFEHYSDGKEAWEEYKWIKKFIIGFIVSVLLVVFIPSKQTMYTMLVADNVTYENVEIATDTIKDGVDYIFEKLDGDEE